MAAHAHLVAPRRRQPTRVEDAGPDLLQAADAAEGEPHVLRARPVTALAADPLRPASYLLREDLWRAIGIGARRHVGIRRVAEEALAPHPPQHPVVVGPVEAGGHAPAPLLRVPGERQLVELAGGGAIEVGPGMVARAEDPVHVALEEVDRPPLAVELPAAEDEPLAAADDLQVLSRRLVDERRGREVLDVVLAPRPAERPRHPLLAISGGEPRMAERAGRLIDIARCGAGGDAEAVSGEVAGDHREGKALRAGGRAGRPQEEQEERAEESRYGTAWAQHRRTVPEKRCKVGPALPGLLSDGINA